jgi:hypothetical protein
MKEMNRLATITGIIAWISITIAMVILVGHIYRTEKLMLDGCAGAAINQENTGLR